MGCQTQIGKCVGLSALEILGAAYLGLPSPAQAGSGLAQADMWSRRWRLHCGFKQGTVESRGLKPLSSLKLLIAGTEVPAYLRGKGKTQIPFGNDKQRATRPSRRRRWAGAFLYPTRPLRVRMGHPIVVPGSGKANTGILERCFRMARCGVDGDCRRKHDGSDREWLDPTHRDEAAMNGARIRGGAVPPRLLRTNVDADSLRE